MLDIVKKLSEEYSPSGCEKNFSVLLSDMISGYCKSIRTDSMKNLLAIRGSKISTAKRILIDAHYDEIALVVTGYEDGGFLRFSSDLGYDLRTLISKDVVVHGISRINGVVTSFPPHLKENKDKFPKADEMFIDTGYDTQVLKSIVPLGSMVTSRVHFSSLKNGFYSSRALDNKLGVAAIIGTLRELGNSELDCEVAVSFSVQEEAGLRGASAAAAQLMPDACIVLDVSHGYAPGAKKEKCGICGNGPMIGVSAILSSSISNGLINCAKNNNISYQIEVMGGSTGTNANVISKTGSGIPTGLISIPLRYMHTPAETFALDDLTATKDLLCKFIRSCR